MWLCEMAFASDPESRPVPLETAASTSGSGFPWITLLVVLAAAAVVGWMRWRHAGRSIDGISGIRIISRVAMGRGRSLSLVRVGDRVVLVGESGGGFQRLAEFDSGEQASTLPRRAAG